MDCSRNGKRARTALTNVVLPVPDGADITKTMPRRPVAALCVVFFMERFSPKSGHYIPNPRAIQ
jgi:hypothetical protein